MKIPTKVPPGARLLPLSQGRYAIVDADDWDRVNQYKWSYHGSDGYAIRLEDDGSGSRKTVELHRFVLGYDDDKFIDHINNNKLDCRKSNLRATDNQQNQRNRTKQKNSTTGFKGVSWDKARGKYSAQIQHNGRLNFLGYFDRPEDAARAYDAAAKRLHGEYANLNFNGEEE